MNVAPVITQGSGPLTMTVAEDGTVAWTVSELNATDAAPFLTASPKAAKRGRGSHPSKLKRPAKKKPKKGKAKAASKPSEDQNLFDFMQTENQRGIFGDHDNRNLYEGEDLDVPTYLRRGVKIAV